MPSNQPFNPPSIPSNSHLNSNPANLFPALRRCPELHNTGSRLSPELMATII